MAAGVRDAGEIRHNQVRQAFPGRFCMDGGGEFTGREFAKFRDAACIRWVYTALDTPEQNGVVESVI